MFSLVIPFYNEEECAEEVVYELVICKRTYKLPLTFVLVNNGSKDRTGEIINKLAQKFPEIHAVTVFQNRGYGYGIRQGLKTCTTPYLGFMRGDGQTDPRDVAKVVRTLQENPQLDICKIVRIKRHDSLKRRVISFIYNLLFSFLFLLPMKDVNGNPKMFKRDAYKKLKLITDDWFIDAELILKAKLYDLTLKEIPTEYRKRRTGVSSINHLTMLEFLKNLFASRLHLPLTLSNNKHAY